MVQQSPPLNCKVNCWLVRQKVSSQLRYSDDDGAVVVVEVGDAPLLLVTPFFPSPSS